MPVESAQRATTFSLALAPAMKAELSRYAAAEHLALGTFIKKILHFEIVRRKALESTPAPRQVGRKVG